MATSPFSSPLTFTGVSRFSDDLNQILQRAISIASLPAQKLQLDQTNILAQKTALGDLGSAVSNLTSAFASLGTLLARGAVTAGVSDPSAASIAITGSPEPSSYTLTVTSAAAAAQASTALGLADSDTTAPRSDGLYKLTVGSTTESFDLRATGAGRTAGSAGSATPVPPVSITVDFSNGLTGSVIAILPSFFVGDAAVSGAGAGDTVTVNFISADASINTSITTDPLSGGEDADALAVLLNVQIAANADLNGKVSFTGAGGKLKLVEADTVGQGFTFTSSSNGSVVTGLESGGTIGGQSAEEIAAALNAQVALNPSLAAAGVTFSAVGGQVQATAAGGRQFTFTASDNAQGTGFVSGLAGATRVVGYGNTLAGLRDYLNAREADFGVRATVINTSSDVLHPRYDLSLVATATGQQTLTLLDSTNTDLLPATDVLGSNAVFSLNGGATVINSSNTITDLVAGVNLTILGPTGTQPAVITIEQDRAAIKTALQDFVNRYNAALAKVNAQIGENAGVLTGSLAVRQSHAALRAITGYPGSSGAVQSMAGLGLELSDKGQLSLNEQTFDSLADAQFSDAVSFLGSTTAGFVGNAYSRLTALTDPSTGAFQSTQEFFDESDQRLSKQIADAQDRITTLRASLLAQLSQSDTLLAQLDNQQSLLTGLFQEQRAIQLQTALG